MEQEIKRKRGRPAGNVLRRKQYRLTFSDDEFDRVESLSKITGKTKADIFREAFKFYENFELMKLPDKTEDFDEEEFYDDFDDNFE